MKHYKITKIFHLENIIVLTVHGVNGLACCQEFDNILLSVVECQRRCHTKFQDLVHKIIKSNITGSPSALFVGSRLRGHLVGITKIISVLSDAK